MEDRKLCAKAIVKYLKSQIESGQHDEGCIESLEVAVQCIESAFEIAEQSGLLDDVPNLEEIIQPKATNPSIDTLLEADNYKTKGNQLLKENKYEEALQMYNKAISLHNQSAVFYCNRAAAYAKLNKHTNAVEDCKRAIQIDPTYAKAYSRLGVSYSALKLYVPAREAYLKCLELEPDNVTCHNNLVQLDLICPSTNNPQEEATAAPRAAAPQLPIDGGLIMNFAERILGNSSLRNLIQDTLTRPSSSDLNTDLFTLGGEMSEQIFSQYPDLVDQLRQTLSNATASTNTPSTANATPKPPAEGRE